MIRTDQTLMAHSVRRMQEEWHRKGEERGLRKGEQEGRRKSLRRQRAMVLSQAKLKFGAETAAELEPVLEGLSEWERIEMVAEAIIECSGAGEFIRRAREA